MNPLRPANRYFLINGLRLHCLDWGGDGPPRSCSSTASPGTRTPGTP